MVHPLTNYVYRKLEKNVPRWPGWSSSSVAHCHPGVASGDRNRGWGRWAVASGCLGPRFPCWVAASPHTLSPTNLTLPRYWWYNAASSQSDDEFDHARLWRLFKSTTQAHSTSTWAQPWTTWEISPIIYILYTEQQIHGVTLLRRRSNVSVEINSFVFIFKNNFDAIQSNSNQKF